MYGERLGRGPHSVQRARKAVLDLEAPPARAPRRDRPSGRSRAYGLLFAATAVRRRESPASHCTYVEMVDDVSSMRATSVTVVPVPTPSSTPVPASPCSMAARSTSWD